MKTSGYKEMKHNYTGLDDNKLAELAREHDEEAFEEIVNRYRNRVLICTRPYFLMGADKEDLIQEAFLGLYKAIRDYDSTVGNFRAFALLCVKRQVITAIKTATREKHKVHYASLSIHTPVDKNNGEKVFLDIIPNTTSPEPEGLAIVRDMVKDAKELVESNLSALEVKCLSLYLNGLSYNEIAQELGRNYKSVDAAINRAKIKLRKHIGDLELLALKNLLCSYSK